MIVVTGGAGFIGSNIVAKLAQQDAGEIVVCDRLRHSEKWRNIANHNVTTVIPPDALHAFLNAHAKKITAIIHMGAISSTIESDVDLIFENNVRFSMMLWDWAVLHQGVSFIYASSAATFGDGNHGFDDRDDLDYLVKLRPHTPYGWSKAFFDVNAKRKAAQGQAPSHWAGLKFFNVYGPNEYHKGGQCSVIYQFVGQIREHGAVRLFQSHHPDYADGEQSRDFVFVDDCVDLVLWSIEHPQFSGIFNAGSGKAHSFVDVAKACFASLEMPENITYFPTPLAIQPYYQYYTKANLTKLQAHGYKSQPTALKQGVNTYIKAYLNATPTYR